MTSSPGSGNAPFCELCGETYERTTWHYLGFEPTETGIEVRVFCSVECYENWTDSQS
jgi:hypothetical protein